MRRVTAALQRDEYEFVVKISKLLRCSIARALSLCVSLARQHKSLTSLLDQLERGDRDDVERSVVSHTCENSIEHCRP